MRIGVDASCWSNQRGFGRFTREILRAVVRQDTENEYVFVVDQQTAPKCDFPAGTTRIVVATSCAPSTAASAQSRRGLVDILQMSHAVARGKFDLFFFPAVYSYFPVYPKPKLIVTFHDAIAERHPQLIFSSRTSRCLWSLKAWFAQRQADLIVTVSDFSRSCLVKQWNLNPERVRVIQEAAAPIFKPDKAPERLDDILCELGVPPSLPYLMHVGGLSPHKNLEFLIDVFAEVLAKPEHSLTRLLLVGDYVGDGFYSSLDSIRERIERRQVSSQVILTGYVSDSDLVHLYNGALALMYPSYEEGFGLPALEAMSCGLPVIASRAGSLPEVIGAAGLFFEPGNRRELRARIEAILDDAVLRSNLRKKSLERAREFSWTASAAHLIEIFHSVYET